MSVTRGSSHHRLLAVGVSGLADFEHPSLTCVAVNDLEQAGELITVVHFDLLLVGGPVFGPAVRAFVQTLRTARLCPRWAVVTDDPTIEISARALGAVAVVEDIHDPKLVQLLDSIKAKAVVA